MLLWLACAIQEAPELGEPARPVEVEVLAEAPLDRSASASGVVEALHQVLLISEGAGRVVERAEPGQALEAGDTVLRLESGRQALAVRGAEAQRDKALAVRDQAQARTRRLELLGEGASAAQREEAGLALQVAEADLQAAEAQLGTARRALADTSVRAPLAGELTRILVDVGDLLAAGTPVGRLADLSWIRVELSLPWATARALTLGDPATVHSEVGDLPGSLHSLSGELDPLTGGVIAEVHAANTLGVLPNAAVSVTVLARSEEPALSLPREALVPRFGEEVVFLVEEDRARLRRVVLGERSGDRVEVVEGVQAGDRVVVTGAASLQDGDAVTVSD